MSAHALNWKDTTSRSRDAKDLTPRSWEAQCEGFKVVVTRHIHYPPTTWLLLVLGQEIALTGDVTADYAKRHAEGLLREMALRIAKAVGK